MPGDADFTIRRLASTDVAVVRALWSRRFGGVRQSQDKWFDAALDPEHPAVAYVAVAETSDEPVGFSFLDVAGRSHTREYLGLDALDLTSGLDDRNGIFHLSCVQTDWEGQGIGSAFYQRRLRILADRGVDRAFGISWHRPDLSHDSRILFENWGFEKIATVPNYYARTGGRENCPRCEDKCNCTASLFVICGIDP